MGWRRYTARVGAFAVVFGLGTAIATMPGVANAEPADSGSSSSSTQKSPTDGAASSDGVDGIDASGSGSNMPSDPPTDPSRTGTVGESPDPADDEDVVGSREDEPAGIEDDEDAVVNGEREPAGIEDDEDASSAAGVEDTPPADEEPSSEESPKQSLAATTAGGRHARAFTQPDTTVGIQSPVRTDQSTHSIEPAQTVRTGTATEAPVLQAFAAPASVAAITMTAPPVAVVAPPPPRLDDILEEPHTFLVGVTAHLVDAVLETLLAPFGRGTPAQSPLLWTVLAFVRDEFRRILLPHTSPDPPTPTLVVAPNLLVNPGAEAGDPSLSGYSAVTVPGWTVTGTPTVIRYGTERRFPVPTPSPGPVLPNLLAFPSHDGPIATPTGSGQQFFGGGPVADSTLSQTVDLGAAADAIDHRAGGVQYQLSGDLGGFLIDPSRTKVAVEFLDANGVRLGTGVLKPVTAWDRLFATGFIHRDNTGTIPVGTRVARVSVSMDDRNPVLGNYNNAYADNLSFKVDVAGLAPAPLEPPESRVGELDHVFMVYLENKGVSQIIGSPNAPYLNALIDNYGYASNYYGLTHPSDPNYYPIIGGSDFGINYNCPSRCFGAGTPTLVDRLDEAGEIWAGYMEGGGGYTTPTDRLPFLAFTDIYNDPQLVATHLFDISRLEQDLADPATAPNFVWFAADDATNMEGPTDIPFGILNWIAGFVNPAHQYNVKAGDAWLQDQLTTIFNSPTWQDPTKKSAIFVTFDEDYNNLTTGVGNEGNHIVMIAIPSPAAVAGGMDSGPFIADDHYNHYSLLRTIEESLGLAPLTNNDRYATPMNELWDLAV